MLRDPRNSRHWKTTNVITIFLGSYAAWTLLFRLGGLTLVIYFLTHTSGKSVLFEEVNETFGAHELSFVGFGALAFIFLFKGFAPLWREDHVKLFSLPDLQKSFLPGFVQGALLASALIGALLLSGSYRFVGFFVQLEETPLAILGICMRTLSIFALCYCEEWIFRKKAFELSLTGTNATFGQTMTKIIWISVSYAAVKYIQFELGWMHLLTIFLLSITLSVRQLNDRNFTRGAGFWCGLLVIFQPVFSLPLLGNDFSGVFLVKYQAPTTALRLFSGGEGGPLAGFAFQFLLFIEILRSVITFRKSIR
jgi:hypothetical protein